MLRRLLQILSIRISFNLVELILMIIIAVQVWNISAGVLK